jgi:hypothetical protein
MKQTFKFSLTLKSSNVKVGAIPVSGTSANSCPDSCPMKAKGCYAKSGPISWFWNKVNKNGMTENQFLKGIKELAKGTFWRHNQFGDLCGDGEKVSPLFLFKLVKANRGKKGFTYTHKHVDKSNHSLIKFANKNGFTINLSANNLNEADSLHNLNIAPVTVVLDENAPATLQTPSGKKVIVCPAQQKEGLTCAKCQLCSKQRNVIVGFRAHGMAKKHVSKISNGVESSALAI